MASDLDTLEAKGLIRLAAYEPELEYLFRHWLVQDAAYGSLLKQERRELHRRVGEALEKLYPDRREELAAVLAMHFEQAGEREKAIEYFVAAGRYGLDRNAMNEAYAAFDRALKLLPSATEADGEAALRRRIEIATGRAQAGRLFKPMEDLMADLEEILPEAERLDDPELLGGIHSLLAMLALMQGLPASDPRVRRSLDRIEEVAERLGDQSLRATPMALLGMQQVFAGSLRDGVRALEEAAPLLEDSRDSITASFARGALAIGYAWLGEFGKAEEASRRATELAETGDLVSKLDAEIAESLLRSQRGELDAVVPLARSCMLRAEQTGASACVVPSAWILGDAYSRQGKFAEAQEALQYGNDLALVVDRAVWRPTLQAWLGRANAALDPATIFRPAADEAWDDALRMARSIGNRFGEAGILWKRAEARERGGDLDGAVTDFEASAAIFEEHGARPNLARVQRGLGETLLASGRSEDGQAALRRSLALFEEMDLAAEAAEVRSSLLEAEAQPETQRT
jgi:tetratricopeptide (TPR) repeat protein